MNNSVTAAIAYRSLWFITVLSINIVVAAFYVVPETKINEMTQGLVLLMSLCSWAALLAYTFFSAHYCELILSRITSDTPRDATVSNLQQWFVMAKICSWTTMVTTSTMLFILIVGGLLNV